MNTRLLASFALLASPLLVATHASAQTVWYSTGFESPTFQPGPFAGTTYWNGQDGWLATGDLTNDPNLSQLVVQSSVVERGAQAISIDATGQPTPYAHIRRNVQFTIPAAQPLLDIAFDLRLSQPATHASEWGLQSQAGPGPGSGILEWWIDTNGRLHVSSPTGDVPTSVVLQRERWYRVLTRVDYAAQTVSVSVDGLLAASVPALSGATWDFHAFTSLMFLQPGDDRMYVDDFSLTTHDGSLSTTYCTAGTTTHGCAAQMGASGTPSASATSGFVLQATAVEGAKSGMIFYGTHGRVAWPWAAGSTSLLCVKTPLQRTALASSGGVDGTCSGTLALDFLAFVAAHPAALGAPFGAGATVQAQAWFRDPLAVKAVNTSNALEFTLLP